MEKVLGWIKYVAKIVWGVGLPILYMALVDLISALEGSFVDSPVATLVLSALGIFFAKNGPKPV